MPHLLETVDSFSLIMSLNCINFTALLDRYIDNEQSGNRYIDSVAVYN